MAPIYFAIFLYLNSGIAISARYMMRNLLITSQFSMSLSLWAILFNIVCYYLALPLLLLNTVLKANLPWPILLFSSRSWASFLIVICFRTSHDSFSPIACIRHSRFIISPLTQFLIWIKGFWSSFARTSSLFLRCALVSPLTSLTWPNSSYDFTWGVMALIFSFSFPSSYFWRKSANCL